MRMPNPQPKEANLVSSPCSPNWGNPVDHHPVIIHLMSDQGEISAPRRYLDSVLGLVLPQDRNRAAAGRSLDTDGLPLEVPRCRMPRLFQEEEREGMALQHAAEALTRQAPGCGVEQDAMEAASQRSCRRRHHLDGIDGMGRPVAAGGRSRLPVISLAMATNSPPPGSSGTSRTAATAPRRLAREPGAAPIVVPAANASANRAAGA